MTTEKYVTKKTRKNDKQIYKMKIQQQSVKEYKSNKQIAKTKSERIQIK